MADMALRERDFACYRVPARLPTSSLSAVSRLLCPISKDLALQRALGAHQSHKNRDISTLDNLPRKQPRESKFLEKEKWEVRKPGRFRTYQDTCQVQF